MLFLPRHTHILLARIQNIVICVQNKHERTHVSACVVVSGDGTFSDKRLHNTHLYDDVIFCTVCT